jgi:MbtH protein
MSWDSEDTSFRVVINHEEQYSIWPDYLDIPKGWSAVGKSGKKQECLDYIKEHWVDMRPRSLREHMEKNAE